MIMAYSLASMKPLQLSHNLVDRHSYAGGIFIPVEVGIGGCDQRCSARRSGVKAGVALVSKSV